MSEDRRHAVPSVDACGTRLASERAIVQGFLAPLAAGYPGAHGLLDDCAAFTPSPGHDLVLKTDAIAAGVHFLPDDPPEDIGWKALAVNVSDLAAKAAVPRVYLLSLAFPEPPSVDWMSGFARGLAEAQRAFCMHLVGGDTDRRPGPVTITPMVLGEVPHGRMVLRGAARAGDWLYVSGSLGDAAAGLALAMGPDKARSWQLDETVVRGLVDRYRRPSPRLALRAALRAHARAAMDISDGLLIDLGRMCRASGVAASVETARLPASPALAGMQRIVAETIDFMLAGGDDYEVLAAVAPQCAAEFEASAAVAGVLVTRIGAVHPAGAIDASEPLVQVLDDTGRRIRYARGGYEHFDGEQP